MTFLMIDGHQSKGPFPNEEGCIMPIEVNPPNGPPLIDKLCFALGNPSIASTRVEVDLIFMPSPLFIAPTSITHGRLSSVSSSVGASVTI